MYRQKERSRKREGEEEKEEGSECGQGEGVVGGDSGLSVPSFGPGPCLLADTAESAN